MSRLRSCVSPFETSSSQPLHSPEMAGQAAMQPDLTLSLSEFVPDLPSP
jgi:hypothetical protein